MGENRIKLPEKNTTKEKELIQTLKSCRDLLGEGLDRGESEETKYKKLLDQAIPLVEEEVSNLFVELDTDILKSDKTSLDISIKYLSGL